VPNLTEGETYEFRVKAINAGGMSQPSNEAGPVTCRARNLPPRIDRTNLNEIRCKAGDSFTFDVNVTGEPVPDKIWLVNQEEIVITEKIKIVKTNYNIKLIVRAATRKENGNLTLTARNCNGSDSADVQVTVLDVPSAPIGPLRVKDMTASDCVLEWKPPKDDGGMPIQYYIIEMCDESASARWTQVGETVGAVCTYNVQNLIENHYYRFRVKAVNKEGKSAPLETSGVYQAKNPFEVPSKPGRPKVVDFDSEWAELEWDRPEWDGGSKITGYIIERKDTYSQRWEICSRTESENAVGRVKGLVEGVIYEFRVKAVNKAGESEPSDPSLPHRARPKNAAPRIDRNAMMDIKILAGEPLLQ
jgi:predicted phage tail protein